VRGQRTVRELGVWVLGALCTGGALLTAVSGVARAQPTHAASAGGAGQAAPAIVVFAAASLAEPIEEISRVFATRGAGPGEAAPARIPVRTSFAASSVLAKQIEAGAPADVFVSADTEWMDYLEQRHLLRGGTRQNLLGNQLVLIAPAESTVELTLAPHADLATALAGGRLATGDPDSVPVGRYALAALMRLGIWDQVAPRLVRAENVRAALEYVARGEATLGIVYRTDALAEKRVRLVDIFPADSHPLIVYPVALTLGASAHAPAFEAYLESDAAREIFVRYGFERLPLRTSRSGSP
jgi:molybdate transport system substrate-binding protein